MRHGFDSVTMFRSQHKVQLFFRWLILAVLMQSTISLEEQPKIIIVGAGFAGQATAVRLIENGFTDIVILEAENRTGGRVHSVPFADGFVDLGAQWIEGESGNVIFEMTNGYFDHGDSGYGDLKEFFQISSGEPANQDQYQLLNPLFETILENLYEEMANFNGSFGTFFIKNYHEIIAAQNLTYLPTAVKSQLLDSFERKANGWMGSPSWFDVSAKLQAETETSNGSHSITWKKSGFQTGFDYLTKKLPDPTKALDIDNKIKLNTEVTNIKWNPDSSDEKIDVTCADGSTYTADHVIFTASLGVLKARHETLFSPKLPENKVKAIETIGYGNFGKFFLEYEKPFWAEEYFGYTFLWTDEDLLEIKDSDREWLVSINMIVKVDSFPNLLEGTVVGPNIKVFEELSEGKFLEDIQWMVEKFAGKKLPNPISYQRNRWLTNKNFLGAYSFPSVAAEQSHVSMDDLAETIYTEGKKPAILFAGEATIKEFYGFTHGAVSSGFRAGNEIRNFYSYKKNLSTDTTRTHEF